MENCKINVLGEEWQIVYLDATQDELLKQFDGYTDYTTRTIVVCKMERVLDSVKIIEDYMKEVARHEVVHAFLYESGLKGNSLHFERSWSENEEMVDWFAIQGVKIYKAWKEAGLV